MNASLLLMAAVAIHPAPFQGVKFDVKTGDKFIYASESSSKTDSDQGSFSMTAKAKSSIEITGTKDGWIQAKTTLMERHMDTDGPMGDMMGDPQGMVATYQVSPQRKVKDWKITESGNLTPEQVDAYQANGEGEAKAGLDGLLLPDGDITEGTTWENEHEPGGAGIPGMKSTTTGKVKTVYTAGASSGSGADRVITITAVTSGAYTMNVDTPQGSISIDVKQDMKSTFTVRAADGVVTKIETNSTNNMSMQFGDFTTTTKTTTELVKA